MRDARPEEAVAIAALIRIAFQSQAKLYEDDTLPPLFETAETVRAAMTAGIVLVAEESGRIVGSVRGDLADGTCRVGRLVVEPDVQGQGVGRVLASAIEQRFAGARRFEIFTGHRSAGPLHLYTSLGYAEFRRENVGERLDLVFLEKTGPGAR
ncbi:MAG: GNAT family N-acetyltransferase [Actinomycetota bacterium]|nr:GNAT family N-acetyltransferase [Actinomycetota bacterium]